MIRHVLRVDNEKEQEKIVRIDVQLKKITSTAEYQAKPRPLYLRASGTFSLPPLLYVPQRSRLHTYNFLPLITFYFYNHIPSSTISKKERKREFTNKKSKARFRTEKKKQEKRQHGKEILKKPSALVVLMIVDLRPLLPWQLSPTCLKLPVATRVRALPLPSLMLI